MKFNKLHHQRAVYSHFDINQLKHFPTQCQKELPPVRLKKVIPKSQKPSTMYAIQERRLENTTQKLDNELHHMMDEMPTAYMSEDEIAYRRRKMAEDRNPNGGNGRKLPALDGRQGNTTVSSSSSHQQNSKPRANSMEQRNMNGGATMAGPMPGKRIG